MSLEEDRKVGGIQLLCSSSQWLLAHSKIGPHELGSVLRTNQFVKDPIWQSDSQLKASIAKNAKKRSFWRL